MKRFLFSSAVTGLVIVIGEGILNGVLLKAQWDAMNSQLGLAAPSEIVLTLAMVKLFVLGFLIMWLYDAFRIKYEQWLKAALASGLTVGFLIWVWALAGLLLAGYINTAIAVVTLVWGLIELPLAAIAGSYFYEKQS